jgi:hypothetical protein
VRPFAEASVFSTMKRRRLFTLALAGLLTALVTPTPYAAGADNPRATASAGKTLRQQVIALKKQVRALRKRVGALQGQSGPPARPSGPAGGDLIGTFPNPLLAPASVGSRKLADGAVTASKLSSNAVTNPKIADESVSGAKIANGTVGGRDIGVGAIGSAQLADEAITAGDLAASSVGASEMGLKNVGAWQLKRVRTFVSLGLTFGAGEGARQTEVTCPEGYGLLGGGFSWRDDEPNSIVYSTPSEKYPESTWTVRGLVHAGSNTLYAWANCLDV